MGINIDHIVPDFLQGVSEILPNFICPICDDLIDDAVTLNCQHNFCRFCLTGEIAAQIDNKTCPECQITFNAESEMEGSKLIRNLLSAFKFNCLNDACEVIVMYNDLKWHPENCLYEHIPCSFCEDEIIRKDLESHQVECMDYVKCQNSILELENCSLKTEIDLFKKQIDIVKAPGLIQLLLNYHHNA